MCVFDCCRVAHMAALQAANAAAAQGQAHQAMQQQVLSCVSLAVCPAHCEAYLIKPACAAQYTQQHAERHVIALLWLYVLSIQCA